MTSVSPVTTRIALLVSDGSTMPRIVPNCPTASVRWSADEERAGMSAETHDEPPAGVRWTVGRRPRSTRCRTSADGAVPSPRARRAAPRSAVAPRLGDSAHGVAHEAGHRRGLDALAADVADEQTPSPVVDSKTSQKSPPINWASPAGQYRRRDLGVRRESRSCGSRPSCSVSAMDRCSSCLMAIASARRRRRPGDG